MSESVKIATIGPAGVGKTSLITAVIDDAQRLLAGMPASVVPVGETSVLVHDNRDGVRAALAEGEFKGALGGTQELRYYRLGLRAGPGHAFEIPFDVLDFPGKWLSRGYQFQSGEQALWQECEEHVADSVMMLLPIDASVVMEARTAEQRRAVWTLLGLPKVEELVRDWAKYRIKAPAEPAVLVLAPLKCEKYFRDGPRGRAATILEERVRELYGYVLRAVKDELHPADGETAARPPVRIVYAPIDTYGCVELIEADWLPRSDPHGPPLELEARYRVLGRGIQQVRAAGVIVQELCQCILEVQSQLEAGAQAREFATLRLLQTRDAERKGFWGTIKYHLGKEAELNRRGRGDSQAAIKNSAERQRDLKVAIGHLARLKRDERVRNWEYL